MNRIFGTALIKCIVIDNKTANIAFYILSHGAKTAKIIKKLC